MKPTRAALLLLLLPPPSTATLRWTRVRAPALARAPASAPALAAALAAALAPVPAGEIVEPDFGFRLPLPAGWSVREDLRSERSLRLTLVPDDAPLTQLVLSIDPAGSEGLDPEQVRDLSLRSLSAREDVTSVERTRPMVLGQARPGLAADLSSSGVSLRVSQVLLDLNGQLLVLQVLAPAADFDAHAARCAALWERLDVLAPSPARAEQRRLQALAARCGSEIDWARDWEQAATRARESDRPVLVWIHQLSGFAISDAALSGPFMDPDVVALIGERFVALTASVRDALPFKDPRVYGLGPFSFGNAALVVDADGRVLDESLFVDDQFLRDALVRTGSLPAPLDPTLPRDERVARLLDQGELRAARELLGSPATATQFRLLARYHRRRHEGALALAALDRAVQAPGARSLGPDLVLDRARLSMLRGEPEHAAALYAEFLEREPEHPRVNQARFLLAALRWRLEGRNQAEPAMQQLTRGDPTDRWSWKAAATLLGTSWSLDRPPRSDWLDASERAEVLPPREDRSSEVSLRRARDDALAWLRTHQKPDGSWITPSALGRLVGEPPDELSLASVAVCARALVRHARQPALDEALDRALRWVRQGTADARERGRPAVFMDYAVWSRAALLQLLAAVVRNDPARREELFPDARSAVDDLTARVRPGGGWSYYVSGRADATADVPDQAMSFTTAAVSLALIAARDVGLPSSDELLDNGLDALLAMRADNGQFTYMRQPGGGSMGDTRPEEAAARGPVCTLALWRGGRVPRADLTASLEAFVRFADGFSAERGKALMHTGPLAQGSHYLLFDDAHAALALERLSPEQRASLGPALLAEVIACRTRDGSHVDNPIVGHSAGTALALLAYDALLTD